MHARCALQFIVGSGWDEKLGGGTWWDTYHHHKTIEPLAAAVMIGTRLYEIDKDKWALGWAKKLRRGQTPIRSTTVAGSTSAAPPTTPSWTMCRASWRPPTGSSARR